MASHPTILISDDDPRLVKALTRDALRHGLDALPDTDSNALDIARREQPELILLDVDQRIDGRDLLRALKADPDTRHIPVVVLTGTEDQFTRRLCLELGADEFQTKPCDALFMHRIARTLHERPAPTASSTSTG